MLQRAVLKLSCIVLLTLIPPVSTHAQTGERCFPETGFCISGPIRRFWEQNGGLSIFGFPIAQQGEEIIEGQPFQVQWFERERFELHPENPPPYDVLLGRLGEEVLRRQGRDWWTFPKGVSQSGCQFFETTGHTICEPFLNYWRSHGLEFDGHRGMSYAESLALFGLPLSEPSMETNSSGFTVLTQWFERARFEYLPDNPDPYKVLLGLLGNELLTKQPSGLCLGFEAPLGLGTQYGVPIGQHPGDVAFTINGIRAAVYDFAFPGGGGTFNYAQIDSAPVAFGSGQSIRLNNINLEFDFSNIGFQPAQVSFEFLDLGGIENLSVNGSSPLFVGDLPSAPSPIGGVSLTVSTSPVTRGKTGTVTLTGPVKTLRIGGQELWIDRLCVSSQPDGGLPSEKFLTYANSDLELIPGDYLVMFDSAAVPETSVSALANSLVAGTAGTVGYLFTKSLRGFVAKNLTDAWANAVSARPDVSFVRKDFRIYGKEDRGGPFDPVPWNLDRVDQRAPFTLDRDYRFKTGNVGTAPRVPIYILDNGIYQDHQEFAGPTGSRVENVADVRGTNFARCGLTVPDANHGTHVASIAAGAKLGITPTLIKNVKVLDRNPFGTSCTGGSPTTVLMGLEETYKHMQQNNITKAVVNLSLGWYGTTPDVATAISNLQTLGAVVVAAGGNENRDAAGLTPANLPGVLAVGATTQSDARLFFSSTDASNFGSTIALWAPGYNIKGADWPMVPNPAATAFASGTSDAAPHVAGAAALLWQQNPTMSASQVISALRSRATLNMLTNLSAGSNNALLYVGEDAPARGIMHEISRSGSDGDLRAVRVSNDWTRVYVAGGEISGASPTRGPYGYAGYDMGNLSSGPLWQVGNTTSPASPDCVDIHASNATVGRGIPGEPVYFGCMGTHNGAREAMVIASQQDNKAIWQQPAWLGAGSVMGGVTDDYTSPQLRVFVIASRPTATGTEVFITSLDGYDGQPVKSVVLTAPGFTEQFHRAVDVVLIDVALDPLGISTSTDLVAATYSDSPGADKTFLWKLDPSTLQVKDWREVPAPSLATNGMFATALAVQPLEANGQGIVIPGEVFLATQIGVSSGGGTVPWGYIYRLNPDRVTASPIEVVKEAFISSLWSEEGDLYFAGMTTRTFPPGSLFGTPKPGFSPDYDAFLGKSEGVYNRRRWMLTFDTSGQNNSGYGGYGAQKGFIVGSDSNTFYVVEYPVY